LRAIETGELERVGGSRTIPVDVRFVAATNQDLAARVAAGAHPASSATPAIPASQQRVNRSIVETVTTTALAGSCNHHPLSRRRGVTHSFPLTSVK
jgi:hypothetical protein